jgi:UDP-N-acetyl-2-amino-2-deoxyglucuronate dehydrogenase
MINDKLGVAIHGAGDVAYAHAASWLKNPRAKIIRVSSRRKQSAQRLVDKLGLDCTVGDDFAEILRDDRIDIVNISGPNHVHAEQGIAAAEAGKHLLIEKPTCLSMSDNHALCDAVDKARVKSVVSFVLRWNPLFENLKALLAAGAVGKLFYVEVDYWHGLGPSWSGWQWGRHQKQAGSATLLAGCHAIDAIRWFTADEIVEVAAIANNVRGNFDYMSNVVAVVKLRGGAIGKTSVLLDAEMPYQFNIDLVGTEGAVRDNRLWSKRLLPGQRGWTTMQTVMPDSGAVECHPFDAEVNHLVDCILEDRESHCNIADAYHTHEACIAIDRSVAEGGRIVKLPLDS